MNRLHIKKLALGLLLCSSLMGCSEDSNAPSERSIFSDRAMYDKPEPDSFDNPLDEWIYQELTKPYNITVKWRTDLREQDKGAYITPPRPEKVKEFLIAMKRLWLEPYAEEAGDYFIRTTSPKLIYLVGSSQFNSDGTRTEGVAEGGRKITILDIDRFEISTPEQVAKVFHTMHHEFGHILNQRLAFTDTYVLMSKGLYTGAWYNVGNYDAYTKGFITPYSMLNEYEDFVEIAGTILSTVGASNAPKPREVPVLTEEGKLVEGQMTTLEMTDFEYLIHLSGLGRERLQDGSAGSYIQEEDAYKGKQTLRRKIEAVAHYYKSEWGIDIFNLQKRIERAAIALVEEHKKPQTL